MHPDVSFLLSAASVLISLLLGLLGWSLKEQFRSYVKHEDCQKCRAACADGRAGSASSLVRIETKLENWETRQAESDRKQDLILARLDQLPEKFVTIDRLRDMLHRQREN